MKKLIAVLLFSVLILAAVSASAVVPTDDRYATIVDWSQVTQDKLSGGGEVSVFADLSYWEVSSAGTQALRDNRFVIDIEEGEFINCYQFSFDNAVNDGNKELWKNSDALRFYMENNTGNEFTMTLYLYLEEGDGRPYMSGSGVYFIQQDGTVYEPDFRVDNSFADRYFYVPEDFKGWVIVNSDFAQDQSDVYVGWMPSVWSAWEDGFDYSLASMDIVGGLGFDIRADEITQGSIAVGNLELLGSDENLFAAPDASDVIKPSDTGNATQPGASDNATQPGASAGTEPAQDGGFPVWAIAVIAVAAAAVIAGIIVIAVRKKKDKDN